MYDMFETEGSWAGDLHQKTECPYSEPQEMVACPGVRCSFLVLTCKDSDA
jgi:hypothetical protein